MCIKHGPHTKLGILGINSITSRGVYRFYDLWAIAEHLKMQDRQKAFREVLVRQRGWGSSVRHRNQPGASGRERVTQTDESEAQAAPKEPSPAFSRSNDGASISVDDGGRSIFGWINGDPVGLISAQPCPNYSRARGGPQQHPDPPDAVIKKRSFEAALEACEDGMEKHSQIAIMKDIKRRLRIAKEMTESSQRLAEAMQRDEAMQQDEATRMAQSQRDSRQAMDLLSQHVKVPQ